MIDRYTRLCIVLWDSTHGIWDFDEATDVCNRPARYSFTDSIVPGTLLDVSVERDDGMLVSSKF